MGTQIQTKHTPIPWRVINGGVYTKVPNRPTSIAKMDKTGAYAFTSPVEREANAHFIVTACNNHEALLKALQELVESPNAKQNAMWDRARAAISRAEGTFTEERGR